MEDSDRLDLEVLQFVGVLRKFVGAKKKKKIPQLQAGTPSPEVSRV